MGNHPTLYLQNNIKDELEFLYDHGGILINGNWKISSPYDYLRYRDCLIWQDKNNYILSCKSYSLLIGKVLKIIKVKQDSLDEILDRLLHNKDENLCSDFNFIDMKDLSSVIQIQK